MNSKITTSIGSGFVTYAVEPKIGLDTGSEISAQARVLFNTAPPQDTATLTQLIDGVAPATSLTATPLAAGSSNYEVTSSSLSWSILA